MRRHPFCMAGAHVLALAGMLLFSVSGVEGASRREPFNASNNKPLIVIDAGHGGYDRGGIPRQRVAEKSMALDVAQRLASVLRKNGYRVVMTRNSDVFVPLPGRVAIANSYRNALFICVHFNSSTRAGANGIETYYYRSDSAHLAEFIHKNVIAGAPSENRGIRRRGYYVLRKTRIPSVLVECGFLTNPTEARLALQSNYRQTLADNIARGILGMRPTLIRPPASRNYPAATEVEAQPFQEQPGTDFIKAPSERTHSSRRSRSRSHKKSSSKKSSSQKKKSRKKKSEN